MPKSGQAAIQDSMNQVLEAIIKEMVEPGSSPRASLKKRDAVMVALAEELKQSLAHTVSQESPVEKAIVVAALAPALADALAPALADALAPAIVEALSNMAAPKKTARAAEFNQQGPDKQEAESNQQQY